MMGASTGVTRSIHELDRSEAVRLEDNNSKQWRDHQLEAVSFEERILFYQLCTTATFNHELKE